jgi:hypothetical protein
MKKNSNYVEDNSIGPIIDCPDDRDPDFDREDDFDMQEIEDRICDHLWSPGE